MLRQFRKLAIAGMIACAAIWATVPAQAGKAADPLANVHNVVIVSALGDEIGMRRSGVFFEIDKPQWPYRMGWDLDGHVVELLKQKLKGRFNVLDETVDSAMLERFLPSGSESGPDELRARFESISPVPGLDAYVVVHRRWGWIGEEDSGIGITRSPTLGSYAIFAHANFQVTVLDAKIAKPLSSGIGKNPIPIDFLVGRVIPQEKCSLDFWFDDTPSDLLKQRIRDQFFAMVTKAMPYALAEARLTPKVANDVDITEWEGRPVACHQ